MIGSIQHNFRIRIRIDVSSSNDNRMNRPGANDAFLHPKNEAMIQRVLYNDICRRIGGDLNERQATRLMKTVKHYMGEVYRVKGEDAPVKAMNAEVLQVVLPDYLMYLKRMQTSGGRSAVDDIEQGPVKRTPTVIVASIEDAPQDRERMDVGTAFSALQASRQDVKARVPEVKDFRISLHDEPPVSMDMFQRIKEERETEARRAEEFRALQASQASPQASGKLLEQSLNGFAEATEVFSRQRRVAEEEAENAFAERERRRLEARAISTQESSTIGLPEPPDMRSLYIGNQTTLSRSPGNEAAGSITNILPSSQRMRDGGLQQMIITPEPDTMKYKETELNLFVYSADRDWVSNSSETRYNFTVNFDPSNLPTGLRLGPTSTVKFRNIVRIELVKAIMPGESLDILVTKTSATAYSSAINMNLLSFPYIQVRIPELENNNHGTNLSVNTSFGLLQYDANWQNDSTNNAVSRGYFAMIPKFLKCQKVYTPTPLSTLQKLTFQFQRPDGTTLSSIADTLDFSAIFPTIAVATGNFVAVGALTNTFYKYDSSVETVGSAYYWLKTSTYFSRAMVNVGDRIAIKNLTWGTAATGPALTQLNDFTNFVQQDAGLLVAGVGVVTGTDLSTYVLTDSYTAQGYANAILVRGRFQDPTTGVMLPAAPGGISDSYTSGKLSYYLINTTLASGRMINLNRQVQVSLRVITREMDPTGILRPDNL